MLDKVVRRHKFKKFVFIWYIFNGKIGLLYEKAITFHNIYAVNFVSRKRVFGFLTTPKIQSPCHNIPDRQTLILV